MRVVRVFWWGVCALFVYIALAILMPLYMPALSIILPRPTGFPLDARVVQSDLQDGNRWAYCRDLPSGFLWVSTSGRGGVRYAGLSLSYGGRCDLPFIVWKVRSRLGNLKASLEEPSFVLSSQGVLSFAVPTKWTPGATCPPFDAAFYEKASRIISEASQLDDDAVRLKASQFEMARETLKDPVTNALGGGSGGTHFCHIVPRNPVRRRAS